MPNDVVEDCNVELKTLAQAFGSEVSNLVFWLTDASKPEDGNRAVRKKIDRDHLSKASADAQTIKLADLIDNSKSITEFDPGFAKIYMEEKRLLLKELYKGDLTLFIKAHNIVAAYYKQFQV